MPGSLPSEQATMNKQSRKARVENRKDVENPKNMDGS